MEFWTNSMSRATFMNPKSEATPVTATTVCSSAPSRTFRTWSATAASKPGWGFRSFLGDLK